MAVFVEFDQTSLKFEGVSASSTRLVSSVISINLFDGENEITQLDKPINIVHGVSKPDDTELHSTSTVNLVPRCAWYDAEQEVWKDEGCDLVVVEGTTVTCECTHLTIFAVIMQLVEYPHTAVDTKILDVLTKLGVSLSIISLVITLAIYIYCRMYSSHRIVIHANLCVALLLSHLIFVSGIEVNQHHEKACTFIAFLLHYCFMSTFFWMLVEGLYLFVKVKPELFNRVIHIAIWIAIGWGPSLLIVIISIASNVDGYGYPIYEYVGEEISTKYRCWLDIGSGMIWAFAGPACLILLVNLIILIEVMRTFCAMKIRREETYTERLRSGVRVIVVLSCILGLPWLFGLLNFSQYSVVFSYFFVLGNAFQGVYILFSLCIFDNEVQEVLTNKEAVKTLLGKVRRNRVDPIEEPPSPRQQGTSQESLNQNQNRYSAARETPIAWAEDSVPTGQAHGEASSSKQEGTVQETDDRDRNRDPAARGTPTSRPKSSVSTGHDEEHQTSAKMPDGEQ